LLFSDKLDEMNEMNINDRNNAIEALQLKTIPVKTYTAGHAKLIGLAIRLNDKSTSVYKAVFEQAKTRLRLFKKWTDWSWWISAFLFALGWGLGLLGRLYGVPEAAGGN